MVTYPMIFLTLIRGVTWRKIVKAPNCATRISYTLYLEEYRLLKVAIFPLQISDHYKHLNVIP
jgi:hypothetical protein